MIKIRKATANDTDVLAHLADVTWLESHGHYIEDKNDVIQYREASFSVSKTREEINNPKNIFYITYVDNVPAGYAKIVLNEKTESVASQNSCRLQRIYIQSEFIPLKIGQQLLTYVEAEAKALHFDTMWLTTYILNPRAIRFYERNAYENVGAINFNVSGKEYENIVFSKVIG